MTLSARQKALLSVVVERYVRDAEPIGSASLSSDASFRALFGPVSSATIRNELADLEELGLLSQPHTSAGRVPTDAGYRFYVNEMLRPRALRTKEKAAIQAIPTPPSSVEDALREATALLAQMTGYPAVATLPLASRDTMRQVQISPVPPHRLLLVLLTQSGRVENRLFEVGADEIGAARLGEVANFLNEQLRGRTLSQVRSLSFEDVSAGLHDTGTIALARRAWEHARASVGDLHDERLVVQGVVALLNEPEFSEIEHARGALRLFENVGGLSDLLSASISNSSSFIGVGQRGIASVVIGREHGQALEGQVLEGHASGVESCVERLSFVGIAYGAGGEILGTVGVLGPTRMKYGEALALVPALGARLGQSLESL